MDRSSPRLRLLALLVAFMFAALSTRLWYLQVLAAEKWKGPLFNNTVKLFDVPAPRGRILASNGEVIVGNDVNLEVLVEQQKLGPEAEAVLLRLSKLLDVRISAIRNALSSNQYYPSQPIPIAENVSQDAVSYIAEHQDPSHDLFPGVTWIQASVRQYPQGDLAAQILGSVGRITAEQAKEPQFHGYGPSEIVGRSGLESEYERWLRGTAGIQKYLVDPAGKAIRQLGQENPVAGDDVRLYLNLRTQRIVEDKLREGILNARHVSDTDGRLLKATGGAAVVLDPNTGGIEAMASFPTFDPSWLEGGVTRRHQRMMGMLGDANAAHVNYPLVDRAIASGLAPGSTFKPFVALSAIRNGLASIGGTYDCPGEYTYPGDTSGTVFHNWTPIGLGYMPISTALKVSCDTVFYRFGGEFYSRFYAANQLGNRSEPLQQDLRGFGFGRTPGVDLPGAVSGLIPTAEWKQQYAPEHPNLFRPDEQTWLPGDDINMSIGQGFVQVSPLQLASAYAAIANGGRLCAPRIAEDVQRPDGKVVHQIHAGPCRRLPYSASQISYVRHALQGVTQQQGGTAYYAFQGFPFSQVQVGGKTGTAQRAPLQDTSWFAALVGPVDAPQHVIVVMVEQGGHGSTTAAPIARSIIEGMYHLTAGAQIGGSSND